MDVTVSTGRIAMNSPKPRNISEKISEVLSITQGLTQRVAHIRTLVRKLESHAQAKRLDDEGSFQAGKSDSLICVLARAQPDPLWDALTRIRQKSTGFPSLILVNQRDGLSNSITRIPYTAKSILGEARKCRIAVLTWSHSIDAMGNAESIVVGERYIHITDDLMKDITSKLEEIGVTVYKDAGLYGGGRLTHDLISVMNMSNLEMVLEATLPLRYTYKEEILTGMISAMFKLGVGRWNHP